MYRETDLENFRILWVKDWFNLVAQNHFMLLEIVYLWREEYNAFYNIAFDYVKKGQRFRCQNTTHAMCANTVYPVLCAMYNACYVGRQRFLL